MKDYKSNKKKLETLIENCEKQNRVLPKLREMLYEVDRNELIIDKYPNQNIPSDLYNNLTQGLNYFAENVGELKSVDLGFIDTSYSLTVSGSTAAYSGILEYKQEPFDQQENKWKYFAIDKFDNELKDKKIETSIKYFFKDINSSKNKTEFEELINNKIEFEKNLIDHSAFSNKMRNVCLHFKGILKKAADIQNIQKHGKTSKKKMSWPKMAEQLVSGSNTLKKDFETHGKKWTKIHSNLSGKLKDYDIKDKTELIRMYNGIVRLLNAFIEIIDKDKIKNAI